MHRGPGRSLHGHYLGMDLEWIKPTKFKITGNEVEFMSTICSRFVLVFWDASGCAMSVLSHVLNLCDPMGCSLPGSSVHGISQARILELVAISSSRSHQESPSKCLPPTYCHTFLLDNIPNLSLYLRISYSFPSVITMFSCPVSAYSSLTKCSYLISWV